MVTYVRLIAVKLGQFKKTIAGELLQSERSYVKSLERIVNVYLCTLSSNYLGLFDPLSRNEFIEDSDYSIYLHER